MSAFLAAAWLAAVLAPGEAPPAPAAPEEKAEVRVKRMQGVHATYATVPGRILSVVTPLNPAGGRWLILLVAPTPPKKEETKEDSQPDPCADPSPRTAPDRELPRSLVRLDLDGEGSLLSLRDDLPPETRAILAADLNGDRSDDLVVVRDDAVAVLLAGGGGEWGGALERVATLAPEMEGAPRVGVAANGAGGATLWMAELGALRSFERGVDGAWSERPPIPVPVQAKKSESTLQLTTSEVLAVSPSDRALPLASAPVAAGSDRLQTFLIRPGGGWDEPRTECWSRLPEPERVREYRYLEMDGSPALFVATRLANKLSLFGEQLVRLFPLGGDRTRQGRLPGFAVESGANHWQEIHSSLSDVNGDGRVDLVLGYWKGLTDATVVLEAYLRRADGTFDPKARTTTFDVEGADRSILLYGGDLDGRGLPDLLLLAQDKVHFHPGTQAAADGRRIVEPKAAWTAPLPGASTREEFEVRVPIGSGGMDEESFGASDWVMLPVNLDGDSLPEILCVPRSGLSSGVVAVLRPIR